ncbi:hypothetical protein Q31b_36310 [Novipirellula aureliae]|uniref:Uncharacterized protein n=1 Tax=Novipirellula aureliae TaxID=2527966 RepID=A0A5C6DVM6_9BACT|nr:hypothetical protein [Novipirellula aureliae]TWU40284.1 hypothetical protein Q31b_36310 [Novipirellula aureliae]
MKTRLAVLAIVVLLGTLAFVTRSCGIWPFNGVVVAINNVGSIDYESCVVNVTGRSYDLGTLPVDATLTTNVSPTGETHVELDLTEYDGSQHHLVVDCYFERRGYSGTITVDLGDGKIHGVANDVGIGFP